MLVLRYLICAVTFMICVDAELSIRDRIKLHKEWLAKRAALAKKYDKQNNNEFVLPPKITYLRKIIKFRNPTEPMSENDISFIPHLKNEPKIIALNNNRIDADNGLNGAGNTTHEQTNQNSSYEIITNNATNATGNKYSYTDTISTTTSRATIINSNENNVQPKDLENHSPIILETKSFNVTVETSTVPVQPEKEESGTVATTTDATPMRVYSTTLDVPLATFVASTTKPQVTEANAVTEAYKNNTRTNSLKSNEAPTRHIKKSWGTWSTFSGCSRTCGGGVKTQSRNCIKREYINGKKKNATIISIQDCIGVYKRYHFCNEQLCSDEKLDFREEQCTRFNNDTFQGKRYIWEAYIKVDAECELNCKPVGMKYFATLNKTVIDGTLCTKPDENFRRNYNGKAICVEGVCKAVHKSGVISGAFMNNGAVRCGESICRPISGLFTKNPLPDGYMHVATIPAGASNISITELKNSMNFLVLKTADQRFIINGDYTVSLGGPYDAAGTVFDYRRIDGLTNGSSHGFNKKIEGVTEWITSTSPTNEPVHLMVLAKVHNPGVKYEYLLPVSPNSISTSEEDNYSETTSGELDPAVQNVLKSNNHKNTTAKTLKKRRFLWKIVGFTACSKTCGGGIKSPIIRCVREAPTRIFSPKRCAHMKQPELNEHLLKCNIKPCPAYWKLAEWSECNCGNYDEEVFRTREVKCVQELTSGIVIQVNSGACIEEAAPDRELCECLKQLKNPELEIYKYKPTNRKNKKDKDDKPRISIISNNTIIKREHAKKTGTWLSSDWNEQCSAVCGVGLQFRSIFCDRNASPQNERCDLRFTPETTRECLSDEKCAFGEWFTGPWSKCLGDCFNLTRSRSTVCIKNDGFATEEDCNAGDKPLTFENCKTADVSYCKPKWHYSDWTECNKACGGGTQRRTAKCLEPDVEKNEMREAAKCRYAEREVAYRNCNSHSCTETKTTTADPTVELIQNDECQDQFPNCHRVMKARLCSYSYYSTRCCHTCRLHSNELY